LELTINNELPDAATCNDQPHYVAMACWFNQPRDCITAWLSLDAALPQRCDSLEIA
jgi:hypothetical protein